MKGTKLPCLIYLIFFMCCSNLLYSGSTPEFSIIPSVPNGNIVRVPANGTGNVTYIVTNNTKLSRPLIMVPMTGISMIGGGATNCVDAFFLLAPNQSCVLELEIQGSQIPGTGYFGGPIICKRIDKDKPDPFLCSEPLPQNVLNIYITARE
ncbi:protein with a bacterial immunoglobulin-like domain protein [Legionella moravica]|uniref:Protein with a bacterial immunoglobulin-like domain n=1 Tax=Legionella moravica TaxID=39962 RepID=A0A378K3S5_9GAMM|nr:MULTISPECIES: hypothetical protein [Legionella]KTD34826.1 protein with a bacterial immunoglobulin-like domain protein [Legionella moravica]RUR17948.1 hypothetical protein ELY21_09395 [Legionella sp. km535]STX63929.1 protein with a bacterial immunoglobulin-like domain [Legionella moravica]